MTDRLDELLAAAAVEHLGEDAGLGSITAWVELHKAAPDLLAALGWFVNHADSIAADLMLAHHSRGEGGSQWMVADDREFRADFDKAAKDAQGAIAKACNE